VRRTFEKPHDDTPPSCYLPRMSNIPSKSEILTWITENPTLTAKRDIAKAFGIKGAARIDLKRMLKELEAEGHLEKRKKSYQDPDRLPPVSVLKVAGADRDGDLFAEPMEWHGEGTAPRILIIAKRGDPALGEGDRILSRLTLVTGEDHAYEARLIRRIGTNPKRILGIFRARSEGGRIVPIDKGGDKEWAVEGDGVNGARDGELVEAEQAGPKGRMGLPKAKIVDRLGDPSAPRAVSLIAIHQHGIPDAFPDDVVAEADAMKPAGLKGHTFHRGLMRSPASLHYEEVQQAIDGQPNDRTKPLLEPVLRPLYAAYAALQDARARRQPLDLDLPERRIVLDDDGTVQSVNFKDRLDAHKLIEEFMVLANVAAAETLLAKKQPLLFRVHEEPPKEKLDSLRETAQAAGFNLAKGQVLQTAHLNKLLNDAAGSEDAELINISTLRSMTQAYYAPQHIGHFGLALKSYAHFTSPIRRYADLVVHRALCAAHGWSDMPLEDFESLEQTGQHISDTERRSMTAERDTTDRYLASYLSERVGSAFTGRISGVARFGCRCGPWGVNISTTTERRIPCAALTRA